MYFPYLRGRQSLLAFWDKKGINKSELLVINTDRDYLNLYETTFGTIVPRFALMPDESVFRRKIRHHKVLLDDKFEKQERNADYQDEDDEFFSDDHLYYKEDGFVGFSDYSVVGNEYLEAGFAPYAVAIHIVYFAKDGTLRRCMLIARTFKSSLLQRWSSSFVAEWNDQKYEITSQKGGYIKVFSCGSAGILAARNCAMLVGDLLVNHM